MLPGIESCRLRSPLRNKGGMDMRQSVRADGSRGPFDVLTLLFHWMTVALVSLQAVTGFVFANLSAAPRPLLDLHRSSGAAILAVTVLRLLWRASFAKFPPFPASMPMVQQRAATASEYLIYALLLAQALSGLATTLLLGKPFRLLAWTVPALLPRDPNLWLMMLGIHRMGAYALFALVSGHAVMALIHHYVLGDDVLALMMPSMRRKRTEIAIRLADGPTAGRILD
jgi:cytochrome b561